MKKCNSIRANQLNDFRSLGTKALQKLLASSKAVFLPKGTSIFKENEQLKKLYCIKKGACKFSVHDAAGREHILRILGDGDVMGKRSIISNKGAKVTATTLCDTELCCLDKGDVLDNLKSNPVFCNDLMNAFIEDVNTNEDTRIIFSTHKGIRSRLAKLLLYLAEKFGQDASGRLKVHLKREDMAAVLGTSQEYIINLLKIFKDKGYIKTTSRAISILSKKGLETING